MSTSMIEQGWAALNAGDVATACDAFEEALAKAESGAAREGLGQALYLRRDYAGAIAQQERAYAAYRRDGHTFAAARAARNLAWITGNVLGDWAVHNGWLARARRILEEVGDNGAEHAWVLIISSYSEPDAKVRQDLCREAIAIGRRVGDSNIEIEALASLGALYLMIGRTDEGLAILDESMAALCAGELTEIVTMDNLAMADYQARRDTQVLPMYEFTRELATLEPPPPELQQLLDAISGNQEAMDGFARVNAGVTSPAEFFSPENVEKIMLAASAVP